MKRHIMLVPACFILFAVSDLAAGRTTAAPTFVAGRVTCGPALAVGPNVAPPEPMGAVAEAGVSAAPVQAPAAALAAAGEQKPATAPPAPAPQKPPAPVTQAPAAPAPQNPPAAATQKPAGAATQKPPAPAVQKPPAPVKQPPAARKAPKPPTWTDRAFITVDGVYQATASEFSTGFTFDTYTEEAHVTSRHRVQGGPAFAAGVGVRAWRNLALGLQVTTFSRSAPAEIDASVPHPLYLARGRHLVGWVAAKRQEVGVHVFAAWVAPVGRRMLVTIGGGPSFLCVKQPLVGDIRWEASYPYDSAIFTGADARPTTKSAVGINAGLDVAWYFTRTVGVGGGLRYAGGSPQFVSRGGSVRATAGGLQAGMGLRIRLPRPPPKQDRGRETFSVGRVLAHEIVIRPRRRGRRRHSRADLSRGLCPCAHASKPGTLTRRSPHHGDDGQRIDAIMVRRDTHR